jgi:hypothetical protein
MFDEVLWLAMNSEGGISYSEAYHMPIAYRAFNVKKISDINLRRKEEVEKAKNGGTSLSMADLSKRKEDLPDFTSPRAAKK